MKKTILLFIFIFTLFTLFTSARADWTLTEGEGIDLIKNTTTKNLTISGEDASTTNKGIASFVSTMFSVANGAVSILDTWVRGLFSGTSPITYNSSSGVIGINQLGITITENQISDLQNYLITESDPAVTTHLSTYNHTHYDTAYGWGNHSTAGYLITVDISDNTNLAVIDPITLTGDTLGFNTTLKTNYDIAYTHSQNNTQAHSDYLLNTGDTATGNYTFDTDTFHIDSVNNRVGIGTVNPLSPLYISNESAPQLILNNPGDSNPGLTFSRAEIPRFIIVYNSANTRLDFSGGEGNELVSIKTTGKVGIGTTSPTTTLDVNGTINATSANIGDVSNTELQHLNGVTSAIQEQIDNHTSDTSDPHKATLSQTNLTLGGIFKILEGGASPTLYGIFSIADLSTADKTYTFPDATGEVSLLGQSIGDAEVDDTITLTNITQITNRSHTSLSDIGTNAHSAIDTFIASKAAASGLASLNASTLVVENPANATSTPTASKIPIADASAKLDGWITLGSTITDEEIVPTEDVMKAQIHFDIDGGGSVITTGAKAWVRVPFNMTITGWDITANESGSVVIDCWKDTYANFPPTVADTIAGSEKPTLTAVQKNQDTSLTTWTTSVTAGDYIRINVDSITTCTKVAVDIYGNKT